jgi:hypothetical protein
MKKLLFPIASFIVGIICSVAITGHASSARVLDQLDDRPRQRVSSLSPHRQPELGDLAASSK